MSRTISSFSPCGEFFVTYRGNDCLNIWETATNSVKKQFDVNTHTNSDCTSLIWGSFENLIIESIYAKSECQLLIIGTEGGSVYLYDYNTGKLYNHFMSRHGAAVNDLSLHLDTSRLFSCSSDKSVIIWDITTGKSNKQLHADQELYSVCIIDENNLLTGSSSILWWDLTKETVLKEFDCSENPTLFLSHVISTEQSCISYFLSAAHGESKINAWSLNKRSRSCVASFALSEEILNIDANKCFSKDNPLLITAVTKSGSLVLFQHVLNGKTKNLTPQMTLKVMAKPTKRNAELASIPVISSKILDCAESCIIAYGSIENPVFESVNIYDCPKTLTLTREIVLPQKTDEQPNKKLCATENDCMLINGKDAAEIPPHSSPKRRKQKETKSDTNCDSRKEGADHINNDVDIESRISHTSSPNVKKKTKPSKKSIPTSLPSDSESDAEEITVDENPLELSKILIKGIEEKKKHIVNSVLKYDSEELIRSIVRNFPQQSLGSILLTLHRKLTLEEKRYNPNLVKWLKETLNVHLSYLITRNDLTEVINNLKHYIDKKEPSEILLKLNFLRGLLKVQLQNLSSDESSSSSESDSEQPMES